MLVTRGIRLGGAPTGLPAFYPNGSLIPVRIFAEMLGAAPAVIFLPGRRKRQHVPRFELLRWRNFQHFRAEFARPMVFLARPMIFRSAV